MTNSLLPMGDWSALDGILHLDVLDRSYTATTFNSFVDGLLDNMKPFPMQNSVIVMDNASIHKSPELEAMVLARQAISLEDY